MGLGIEITPNGEYSGFWVFYDHPEFLPRIPIIVYYKNHLMLGIVMDYYELFGFWGDYWVVLGIS